ncbi:CvpA family protein [Caldalkalibacillus salinus]|uniref:CvpA family protein n=1 Tax=Caldalkalibacillus salinus TaxID=2803787 RepID=UPI0019217B9B|nr:CvpA family protein [Caldalkalibacillus salinus]
MGMMDVILIICFLLGFYTGYRRGFILQAVHLVGFIVAYVVAYRYFRDVAPMLETWVPYPFHDQEVVSGFWVEMMQIETLFYSAIAFALLFFSTKFILMLIGHLLTMIARLPVLNFANRWLGGILGFVGAFIVTFVLVHVMLFIPWQTGQDSLTDSAVATWMLDKGSFLSDQMKESWNTRSEI